VGGAGGRRESRARDGGIDNFAVYRRKFAFLSPSRTWLVRVRARLVYYIARILFLASIRQPAASG